MGASTSIEWAESTWNPMVGCSRVSEGCRNCYAERVAVRFMDGAIVKRAQNGHGPRWTGKVVLLEHRLDQPLRWKRPRRIFVNSLIDLFHESVPDGWIDRVFAVMALAPQHTFIVLTKRAARMRAYLTRPGASLSVGNAIMARGSWKHQRPIRLVGARAIDDITREGERLDVDWPLPNVWLLVSCENQQTADERIPELLQTPAAVRGISAEPLLGPIDLNGMSRTPGAAADEITDEDDALGPPLGGAGGLDWVIVGGESGPGARPCGVAAVRDIVRQCRAAQVPCFVKQLGADVRDRNDAGFDGCDERSWPDMPDDRIEHDLSGYREEWQGAEVRVRLRDRKGGDPSEWPEDLRVREFPTAEPVRASA